MNNLNYKDNKMNEIKELEKNIYDTISKIEVTLSKFNSGNADLNISKKIVSKDISKLEEENLLLKEKMKQLKNEHQKDLDNLNRILEELNSVLGDENV
jgi:t-SNARE complex subunit (syntaxin)